jgi:hypothetical protein
VIDYLAKATVFTLAERRVPSAPGEPPAEMTIEVCRRRDQSGNHVWAVVSGNQVFNHGDGVWEMERRSNEPDPHTHFSDLETALAAGEAECARVARLGLDGLLRENVARFSASAL